MRYRYVVLMVLMLSGVMSCEESQRTAKAINGVNQEFSDRIEHYVDLSTLLIRKVGEDERAWDYFCPYV